MAKRKIADFDRRESDAGTCELFGRLDALYHEATGRRLDRSAGSLETIEHLLCAFDMRDTEEAWAWWMREPAYGRDCDDPLAYFADGSVFDDIYILAFADGARRRLAARGIEIHKAAHCPDDEHNPVQGDRGVN